MAKACFFLFLMFTASSAFSQNDNEPVFAGTLLQYFSTVLEPGQVLVDPFFLFARQYGTYDNHSHLQRDQNVHQYELLLYLSAGLVKNLDVEVVMDAIYTHSKQGNSFLYGDTLVLFGMQLARAQKTNWVPNIRFLIGENLPTGKYKNLSLQKNGIDGSGIGSYETLFILAVGKEFYPRGLRPMNVNLNAYYVVSASAHISGYTIYGGGFGTHGTIYPGQQFIANVALEYSLSHYWTLGVDVHYNYQDESVFWPSSDNFGPLAGLPSSGLVSVAPCIEYNATADCGINCGVWFSVAGRNTDAFVTPICSIYCYF